MFLVRGRLANSSCRCRHRAQGRRSSSERLQLKRQGVGVYSVGDDGLWFHVGLARHGVREGWLPSVLLRATVFFWWEERKGAIGGCCG